MKLIDKDALLAEIDKRMEHLTPHAGQGVILTKVLKDHYEDLRNFINRMSEESASKDLEKEIQNVIYNHFFDLDGIAVAGTSTYATVDDMAHIAKHFFELGLKAQKDN